MRVHMYAMACHVRCARQAMWAREGRAATRDALDALRRAKIMMDELESLSGRQVMGVSVS